MKIHVGTTLEFEENNYIVKEKIDDSGNSTVWKAEVLGDTRQYAVKVLNSSMNTNEEKLTRFGYECQFCKDTNHRNIVKVFDYVAEKGKAYCVMPYYPKTLRTVINDENDTFILFNYIIQLCEAIQFIHNHDDCIIHRDLKPENILVNDDNKLVLSDFGIAHFYNSTKTREREWLGNRRYAAPEQLATDEVTTACDIYALGRIINELFTKQNPSGEAYLTVADKNPLLFPLDRIVQKCRIQNPELRPSIDEILTELYLLEGELEDKINDVKKTLFPENTIHPEKKENDIIEQATQDILLAQYVFENFSDEKIEELNCVYHRNILYDMDETIQNLLFQTLVLNICLRKFNYESNVYIDEQSYKPLNLEDDKEQYLYGKLNSILDERKIPDPYKHITAKIKKIFCSCCNYHCSELLSDIEDLCGQENPLVKAPILHIVYVMRKDLAKEDLRKIVFSDHVTINWISQPSIEIDCPEMYFMSLEEVKILKVFKERYDVIYEKADFKHYYIRFKTRESFYKFKDYALKLARPYYVFEGDVAKIIQVRREYNDIVELEPLDSFDITNTLAKILGLRNDY